MTYQPGQHVVLDQDQPVIIVKPANRAGTKYVVEKVGESVMIVEAERLAPPKLILHL